jgi:hypothetical protein
VLAGVLALGLSSSAVGAEPNELVLLRWRRGEGTSDCADGPTLERRVEARLGRRVFREDATKVLVAEVEHTSSEYVARLYFEREKRDASPRTLKSSDRDCAALEAAVVLALALAIDPSAALVSPAPAVASLPSLEPAPHAELPAAPAPVATAPPQDDRAPVANARAREPPAARMTASLRGLYAANLLPEPAWGLALHVERELSTRLSLDVGLRFLPAVRTENGRYEFGFTGGSAGACVELTQPLDLCGGLLAGALNVTTRNALAGDTGQQPFVGLQLGPRVAARRAGFRFEFGVDLGLALAQPDFINSDDSLQEHPFNATAFVGIGPTIP